LDTKEAIHAKRKDRDKEEGRTSGKKENGLRQAEGRKREEDERRIEEKREQRNGANRERRGGGEQRERESSARKWVSRSSGGILRPRGAPIIYILGRIAGGYFSLGDFSVGGSG